MVLVELFDGALQRQRLTRLLQALHEIGGSGKQNPVAVRDERVAEGGAEVRLPRAARAEQQDRATTVDPSVAGGERRHVGTAQHRHRGKIETVQRFAGWQAGFEQMSLDAPLITFGKLQLGEGSEQPCRRPTFTIGPLGEALPHRGNRRQPQFAQQQRQPRGQVERALDLIAETGVTVGIAANDESPIAAAARKVARLLGDLETYVSGQSNIIIDYATARRREEPISTAITESTVQWLVHWRMNAQQQMRWSPRGAHLMLKVRTSVVNGTLNRDYAIAER
jgi:hypothetical protein